MLAEPHSLPLGAPVVSGGRQHSFIRGWTTTASSHLSLLHLHITSCVCGHQIFLCLSLMKTVLVMTLRAAPIIQATLANQELEVPKDWLPRVRQEGAKRQSGTRQSDSRTLPSPCAGICWTRVHIWSMLIPCHTNRPSLRPILDIKRIQGHQDLSLPSRIDPWIWKE